MAELSICYDRSMLNKKVHNKQDKFIKRLIYIAIGLAVAGFLLVVAIIPNTRMYLKWPYYYAKCGMHAPVLLMYTPNLTMYTLPEDYTFAGVSFYDDFLCTPQEAIDKGYRQFGQ